jgi:hypothetical protein
MATKKKPINEYGYRGLKKPKHTHTYRKSRVFVTLHDGTQFTDHYLGAEGRYHHFRVRGRIKSSLVYQLNSLTKSKEAQTHIEAIDKR